MASWRAPGSILEAPGLDFGGFWERLFEVFDRFGLRFFVVVASRTKCRECQASQERRERPACTNPSLKRLEPSVDGRRCPPQGVFNPLSTEGGARRARRQARTSTSNTRNQHRMALLQVSHEIFVFPLPIIPPQARPVHRKPDAKKRKSLVFSQLWSIFSPSETRFKNDYEKTSKDYEKTWKKVRK